MAINARDARGGARVKVCGAGRGKKASKSTDFGQNWILPRNCLLNFIGFKLTLLRCTPQVLVIFTGRGRAKPPFYGVGRGGPCIPGAYAMFGLWITFDLLCAPVPPGHWQVLFEYVSWCRLASDVVCCSLEYLEVSVGCLGGACGILGGCLGISEWFYEVT